MSFDGISDGIETGQFRLQATHPTTGEKLKLEAWIGDGPPNVTGGYATWETTPRPQRKSLTEFRGQEPLRVTWPFVIDGFADTHSVEDDCRTLEIMAGQVDSVHGPVLPPLIKVYSAGLIPHDYANATQDHWVISGLTWEDAIRDHKGDRTRQQGTLEILQYVQDDVLEGLTPAGKRRSSTGGSTRGKPYVVKKGDTLRSIAAKRLGNAKRWKEIAKLNKIRDPKKLKVGQHLKMPKR